MSDVFHLTANVRTERGKADSRRMRRLDGRIPAVVYGADKAPESISLGHQEVSLALRNEAVYSHILKLDIDGNEEQVVLKDLKRHPSKPLILHVDFLRVSAKEKLTMNVPIHFVGEEDAPGLKAGGVLTKNITEIEIRCLPANLPEYLELNISALEMDAVLHISDLPLPKGVELTIQELDDEHNQAVVAIHEPKVSREDIEADAAEAEAAAEASAEGDAVAEEKSEDASEDKKSEE